MTIERVETSQEDQELSRRQVGRSYEETIATNYMIVWPNPVEVEFKSDDTLVVIWDATVDGASVRHLNKEEINNYNFAKHQPRRILPYRRHAERGSIISFEWTPTDQYGDSLQARIIPQEMTVFTSETERTIPQLPERIED